MINDKNIRTILQDRIKSFNLNKLGQTNDKYQKTNLDPDADKDAKPGANSGKLQIKH